MNKDEALLADEVYSAVMDATRYSPRGQQAAEFKVGISDLGYCQERVKRMLHQEVPDDTDLLPAFIGTALGDHLEAACKKAWPDAITQAFVTVPLIGDSGVYHVNGHPDLLRPTGLVIDYKSTRGLEVVRRTGPSQQQQMQRHCYAKAAWLEGMFPGVPLDQVQVANVWLDRAADDREVHVQMEPYSETWVESAARWLDEVVYAYVNNQDAMKEPPREVCAKTCGFYSTCRALDTDVTGLLTDPEALAAIEMYREATEAKSVANRRLNQAKARLNGVNGNTGQYSVRWVLVNGGDVSYHRDDYLKLDLRRMK